MTKTTSGFLHFPSGFFHHFKCLTSWTPCLLTRWRPLLGLLGRLSRPPRPDLQTDTSGSRAVCLHGFVFSILDHSLDALQSAFCTPRRVALKWCLTSRACPATAATQDLFCLVMVLHVAARSTALLLCIVGIRPRPLHSHVTRQLSRNIRVVSVCRYPLAHPPGVVDTPQASACSRSRRASISKRRGSVPCISPCCERLQTTAATLKARVVRCIRDGHPPPLRAPSSGRAARSGVPTFKQDGTLVQHTSVRLPSRARARPRIGRCRFRRPQVPTPIPAPCPPVFCGERGGCFSRISIAADVTARRDP